jgi:hypothetical protein
MRAVPRAPIEEGAYIYFFALRRVNAIIWRGLILISTYLDVVWI